MEQKWEKYMTKMDMLGEIKDVMSNNKYASYNPAIEKILLARWEKMTIPLHCLGFALCPRFYDIGYLSISTPGRIARKSPNLDKEVAFVKMHQKKIVDTISRGLYLELQVKELQVRRVEELRHIIKDRLQHRNVLIVLEDVDNLEHLEELVGSRDWFGEESRIIRTTRDEHILTGHKVDVIHNISLLNNDESMKLFCKHAPFGHKPIEDYELLSQDVVAYDGGLLLALRHPGRFLCDKDMNEWRSVLARLNEIL
ncbi:TMV resistance protein N [Lactuca sativa]|uniref:TMV resistance protein N n=1 Tax=Lactuca sativa TaxID=4236 RepID=UPI000CD9CBCB|nr:TMV resistance protein N [Lactuca sativa]